MSGVLLLNVYFARKVVSRGCLDQCAAVVTDLLVAEVLE